jgi:hypothetical protein
MGWAYGTIGEGNVGIYFVFETERSSLIKVVQNFTLRIPNGYQAMLLYRPRTAQTKVIFRY